MKRAEGHIAAEEKGEEEEQQELAASVEDETVRSLT
jgi:hypothetical protein